MTSIVLHDVTHVSKRTTSESVASGPYTKNVLVIQTKTHVVEIVLFSGYPDFVTAFEEV